MRNPDWSASEWPRVWLLRHALFFGIPLAILFLAFVDSEAWFMVLSTALTVAVVLSAWRSASGEIGRGMWTLLLGSIAILWGLTTAAAFAGPGDTTVCWPRMSTPNARYAPPRPTGPDPACKGMTPEQVMAR